MSTTTASVIMAEETFTVYKEVQAAMIARYDTGFVQNLPDKTGFSMQWVSKWDGRTAFIKVFLTPEGVMAIEFSKNLTHGICCSDAEVQPKKNTIMIELSTATTTTGMIISTRLLLVDNPEDLFSYGKIAVRHGNIVFSSANCKRIAIGLLEKLLQG
jgi:hypothetical protein